MKIDKLSIAQQEILHDDPSQQFEKRFWDEKVTWKEKGDITEEHNKVVRIKGEHYVIGNESDSNVFRGYGGREFRIKFTAGPHAGQIIETTNLWHQGTIPEAYCSALPDNAIFTPTQKRRDAAFRKMIADSLAEMD